MTYLNLITSQRPPHQTPSHRGLGLQHMNTGGDKHSVHSKLPHWYLATFFNDLFVCFQGNKENSAQFSEASQRGKILSFTNASNTETRSSNEISETATILIEQVSSEARAECASYLPSFVWGSRGSPRLYSQRDGLWFS